MGQVSFPVFFFDDLGKHYEEINAKGYRQLFDKIRKIDKPTQFNLYEKRLTWVDFSSLKLINCFFYKCIFNGCYFMNTHFLKGNVFENCVFADTVFHDCNMEGFYLYKCSGFNFGNCVNMPPLLEARLSLFPSERLDMIGWKKGRGLTIIKLLIPADAIVSNAVGRKCRASYAKVLEIKTKEGANLESATSTHDYGFIYKVGEIVKPTVTFDENRWNECAPGIHFFLTKQEAIDY